MGDIEMLDYIHRWLYGLQHMDPVASNVTVGRDTSGDKYTADLVSSVSVVVAKQEIYDALVRYCRGIDRRDVALVLSAFHPDAVDNHTGPVEPVADRVPKALARATSIKSTSHNLTNVHIKVEGESRTASRTSSPTTG